MAAVRAKISTSFAALPKDIDPFFQTLDLEGFRSFLISLVAFDFCFVSSLLFCQTAMIRICETPIKHLCLSERR